MSEVLQLDDQDRPLVVQRPTDASAGVVLAEDYKPDWPAREGYSWVTTIFGDWIQERDGTSFACSPQSETYWCS